MQKLMDSNAITSFWASLGLGVTLMLGLLSTLSDGFTPEYLGAIRAVLFIGAIACFGNAAYVYFSNKSRKSNVHVVIARDLIAPLVTYTPTHQLDPSIVEIRDELIDLAPHIEGLTKSNDDYKLLSRVIYSTERVRQAKYGDLYDASDTQKEAIFNGLSADALQFMQGTRWVIS